MQQIELTYKASDTEETLDKLFYRPIGYFIAVFCKWLNVSPNSVTIAGIITGAAAGHMFYYKDLTLNIFGILLLIFSETLDSSDGQLARMTGITSKYGRVLDGIAGNIVFLSIYVNIALRMMNEGTAGFWIFAVIIIAGYSHSVQCAVADYYRNAFTYFALNKKKSELDISDEIEKNYNSLYWNGNFYKKFILWAYKNYTKEQELISMNFKQLYRTANDLFADKMPPYVSEEYRKMNKPLIKYYNIMTTNTRVFVLIISILTGYLYIYLIFELTVLNLLLLLVIVKQERNNLKLYQQIIQIKNNA